MAFHLTHLPHSHTLLLWNNPDAQAVFVVSLRFRAVGSCGREGWWGARQRAGPAGEERFSSSAFTPLC